MKQINILLLVVLSAIWGGSFIFMRILSPVFGASGTACLRLLIAAMFLLIYFAITGYKINWKRDWKFLLVIGVINSSIPFFSYAYAALYIPAGLSVIVNTMSPMFGALFAAIILKERLTLEKAIGLALGAFGVFLVTGSKAVSPNLQSYLAIGACLLATFCYGLSGVLIKKYGQKIESKAMAGGSQLFAGLALLPFLISTGTSQPVNVSITIILIIFGVLCSAIAYLIYYYLMKEMGPTKALTVTFLMPLFGIFWGWLILKEPLYPSMLLGAVVILCGTYLVVRPQKNVMVATKELL